MTVSMLARRCGLSRSTLLYYESIRLLRRPPRTAGNYRAYGDADLARLQQIAIYRKVGLGLAAIRTVLDRPPSGAASVLEQRLAAIDREIETLRDHQRAILRLLGSSRALRRTGMITKDKWTAILRARRAPCHLHNPWRRRTRHRLDRDATRPGPAGRRVHPVHARIPRLRPAHRGYAERARPVVRGHRLYVHGDQRRRKRLPRGVDPGEVPPDGDVLGGLDESLAGHGPAALRLSTSSCSSPGAPKPDR